MNIIKQLAPEVVYTLFSVSKNTLQRTRPLWTAIGLDLWPVSCNCIQDSENCYYLFNYSIINNALLGSTVVSPYVGMARKQNGGYNASISVQTPIFHLVVNSTRLKTVRSPRWCCPNSTMAPRLLENVVKVTNLEVVKIVFRHLPFLILLLLLLLQPA